MSEPNAARPMTLDEWVARLPEVHPARAELARLRAVNERLITAASAVVACETGDVWTDDHGWVRPILPELVNGLETALAAAREGGKPVDPISDQPGFE